MIDPTGYLDTDRVANVPKRESSQRRMDFALQIFHHGSCPTQTDLEQSHKNGQPKEIKVQRKPKTPPMITPRLRVVIFTIPNRSLI